MFLRLLLISTMFVGCGGPQPDYITKHGVSVFRSVLNSPAQSEVESWTDEAIEFWVTTFPNWEQCTTDGIEAITVHFTDDTEFVLSVDLKARAFTTATNDIFVGNFGEDVEPLFIHETGHVVAWWCGRHWEDSHEFFQQIGYGYQESTMFKYFALVLMLTGCATFHHKTDTTPTPM